MNFKKENYNTILANSLYYEKLYRVEKIKQELRRENHKLFKSLLGSNSDEICKRIH